MIRRGVAAWIVAAGLLGGALPAAAGARLDARLAHPRLAPRIWVPEVDSRLPVFLVGDPDPAALARLGIRPGPAAGTVRTARVPASALDALVRVPGLVRVAPSGRLRYTLDVSIPEVGADRLRVRAGDTWTGLTGRNVVIGLVDSGLDVTHPDFRHPDGTTRVLFYWDQGDSTGPPPAGFDYGTEWTASQIDAGAFTRGDPVGHGTHVAGIAAGNGSGSDVDSLRYRMAGMAPEADLIVVAATRLLETDALDAASYIFEKADAMGEPAVVNLSVGSQFGPHDGTTPLEQGLDALAGPGHLLAAAAGNEGEDRIHAQITLSPGTRDSASVFVPTYTPQPGTNFLALDGFYDLPESLSVTVVTPGGVRLGPFGPGTGPLNLLSGEGTVSVLQEADPATGNVEVAILLSDLNPDSLSQAAVPAPASGTWWIVAEEGAANAAGTELDVWTALATMTDFAGNGPLWLRNWDPTEEVATPASADRVIAVGSYNTKRCWAAYPDTTYCSSRPGVVLAPGALSYFTSHGPTRDGRQKPELVAPGFVISSSLSGQIGAAQSAAYGLPRTLDPDGRHFVFAGTSMAAPHVSGALALLLETHPTIDPETARQRLETTARTDTATGAVWNPGAGFGKLDAAALVDSLVPVVPRAIRVETDGAGRPRLRWQAASEDPVVAFVLESRIPGSDWTERARFEGPGPHLWTDSSPAGRISYRLNGRLRDGGVQLWAEASWQMQGALILGPARPNPFRSGVRVPVRLGAASPSGRLQAVVVDAAGREVRRLDTAGMVPGGGGWLTWNGDDDAGRPAPAGIYWVVVRDDGPARHVRVVRLR